MTDQTAIMPSDRGIRKNLARLMAVQALYSMAVMEKFPADIETTDLTPDDAKFFQQLAHGENEEGTLIPTNQMRKVDKAFFRRVIVGTVRIRLQADAAITKHLSAGWSIERLGHVKLALLRVATYELFAEVTIPSTAIIKGYGDIAKILLESGDVRFIHGILNKLATTIRV
jgi:transcription antitermination factor NusB